MAMLASTTITPWMPNGSSRPADAIARPHKPRTANMTRASCRSVVVSWETMSPSLLSAVDREHSRAGGRHGDAVAHVRQTHAATDERADGRLTREAAARPRNCEFSICLPRREPDNTTLGSPTWYPLFSPLPIIAASAVGPRLFSTCREPPPRLAEDQVSAGMHLPRIRSRQWLLAPELGKEFVTAFQ